MLYQNSCKGKNESALLRASLSHAISRISIIFNLKLLLSLVKIEKSSKYVEQLQHESFSKFLEFEKVSLCKYQQFQTPVTFVKGTTKNDFCDLLNLATKELFFTFNNKFYIQVDSVAMGSLQVQYCPKFSFHTMKKAG